jgi:hypothetical protein
MLDLKYLLIIDQIYYIFIKKLDCLNMEIIIILIKTMNVYPDIII